eukprot:UN23183
MSLSPKISDGEEICDPIFRTERVSPRHEPFSKKNSNSSTRGYAIEKLRSKMADLDSYIKGDESRTPTKPLQSPKEYRRHDREKLSDSDSDMSDSELGSDHRRSNRRRRKRVPDTPPQIASYEYAPTDEEEELENENKNNKRSPEIRTNRNRHRYQSELGSERYNGK